MLEIRLRGLQELFKEVIYDPRNKTGECFYEKEMLEALKTVQPDILITELDRIIGAAISNYKELKVTGDCRVNPANTDIEACSAHGIPVLRTPAQNTTTVVEMLVGILITYMRKLLPTTVWVRDGQWMEGTILYYTWMGDELHGKYVGFIGFGVVGKAAVHLLDAFRCSTSYYDPYVSDILYTRCELQELLAVCDVISIHPPVLPATGELISRGLLYTMKPDTIFVNTARSVVVDMEALQDMAREERTEGILLGVLNNESSLPDDLEIIENDNVLLTPHICGATYEIIDHQSDTITERLEAWKRQEQLGHIVYSYHSLKMPL